MAIRQLTNQQDLEKLLGESAQHPVLLFKHSTSCPVSAWAYGEFQQFAKEPAAQDTVLALVRVIEERPVSLEVASRLGVTHASPQVLLIRGGKAKWHASHYNASTAAMLTAIEG